MMAEVVKKPIKITETILRDAHQSLIATRMTTEQMMPIVEKLDKVGYHSVECWGGATFDACLRFLDEDPWERLRTIKKHLKRCLTVWNLAKARRWDDESNGGGDTLLFSKQRSREARSSFFWLWLFRPRKGA